MKQKEFTIPRELAKLVEALTEQIYVGNTHLLIWGKLNNYLVENRGTEKLAPVFLGLTLYVHRENALLHLSRVYDKHKDSANLNKIITTARKYTKYSVDPKFLNKELESWEDQLKELERDIKRLRTLRNKFLAHLDYKVLLQIKVLDQDQNLTFGIAKNLYQEAGSLVNSISSAFFSKRTAMEILGWKDFKNLLELAKRGKQAELEEL